MVRRDTGRKEEEEEEEKEKKKEKKAQQRLTHPKTTRTHERW